MGHFGISLRRYGVEFETDIKYALYFFVFFFKPRNTMTAGRLQEKFGDKEFLLKVSLLSFKYS
jgi:hypothetical protein